MEPPETVINNKYLYAIIEQRCGRTRFLEEMRMSEERFNRLFRGEAEFRQAEMIRAAKILELCSKEFTECFF